MIVNAYRRLSAKMLSLFRVPAPSDVMSILAHQLITAAPLQSDLTVKCLLKGCHIGASTSKSYVASEWVCHPVYLLESDNSYVNIDTGVVFLNDCKKYVLETSWGWAKYRTASVSILETSRIYDLEGSEPTYIATATGYHGIVEDLAVILLLFRLGYKFRVIVSEKNKWLANLISLYFPSMITLLLPTGLWVSGKKNLITTKSSFGEFVHPELIRELNRAPLEHLDLRNNEGRNKIFISRGDSKNRTYEQEGQIARLFSEAGYEIAQLSKISVLEQVKLFFNATHVAGIHGAGFVNIAWCGKKIKVWEFFHRNHFNSCYSSLSHVLNHEYANSDIGWDQRCELQGGVLDSVSRALTDSDYLS